MVTSVNKAAIQKCPKHLRLSKHIDMTIHWKALEEHFLVASLVFRFNYFWGKMHFLDFSQKTSVLKELMAF
jgi:hypothetical protein